MPERRNLAGEPWLVRAETQAVMTALATAGLESRIVGGAVRNALVGKPVGDIDMATTGCPETVMSVSRAAGFTAIATGIAHGTVTVVVNGMPFEITTLREDVETFGRHARVAYTDDWTADARRRDFTINALYCDAAGHVYDPVGGLDDLARRRVRFIGEAEARIREDALRILRFFRISAEHGEGPLDPEGLRASVRERALVGGLSAERIHHEFLRLLVAPRAIEAVMAMHEHGLLSTILGRVPRLATFARLARIEESIGWTADPLLRLSALSISVGEDRDFLADRLRLSAVEQAALVLVDPRTDRLAHLSPRDQRAALYRAGTRSWQATTKLAVAAFGQQAADRDRWLALHALPETWPPPVFPLRGKDALALGVAPGPAFGEALRAVEQSWVIDDFRQGPEELRRELARKLQSATAAT